MKSQNSNLQAAKNAKNDEFYTQLIDIENELKYYHDHFRGKTVFLNCDDPRESKFFQYFVYRFHFLGLKKLICTGYKANGHGSVEPAHGSKCVFSGGNPVEKEIEFLKGNGGFETEECIELLQEADIVVSNPPFSKFRDYVELLTSHNKKFLIIGNVNAVTYKNVFPLFKNNSLWFGITRPKEFTVPEGYDAKNVVNGMAKFGNIGWFTNLEHYRRKEEIIIWKEYNEEEYPKYDNYDAINVDKVKDIPIYDGVIGVPLTFLDKYNPEQFEILGSQRWTKGIELEEIYTGNRASVYEDMKTTINGKETYNRIFIRRRK